MQNLKSIILKNDWGKNKTEAQICSIGLKGFVLYSYRFFLIL